MPIDFAERLHVAKLKDYTEFIRRFIKSLDDGYNRYPYFEMSESYIDYGTEQLDDEERKRIWYRKEKLFRSYEKGRIHRKTKGCTPGFAGIWKNISETVILPTPKKEDYGTDY